MQKQWAENVDGKRREKQNWMGSGRKWMGVRGKCRQIRTALAQRCICCVFQQYFAGRCIIPFHKRKYSMSTYVSLFSNFFMKERNRNKAKKVATFSTHFSSAAAIPELKKAKPVFNFLLYLELLLYNHYFSSSLQFQKYKEKKRKKGEREN